MILRHELDITDYQTVDMPTFGDLLSVAQSRTKPNELIDLWSTNSGRGGPKRVAIYIVGTGNPMPEELRGDPWLKNSFLGTVVTPNGLVWHVFTGPLRAEGTNR